MLWATAAALVVGTGAPAGVGAQAMTLDTLSLFDLPGVRVVVEPFGPRAEQDGLHADTVELQIETRLRDAGVPVLTEDQWQVTLGNPLLLLRIDLIRPSDFLYLYRVQLEVQQLVVLARDSTIPVFVDTWSANAVMGTVPAQNLSSVRHYALRQVDEFIDARTAADRVVRPWRRRSSRAAVIRGRTRYR